MLTQMNLSEEEIRALSYKRFRALNPMIQKRLHAPKRLNNIKLQETGK
jgi:hypothetical protein